MNILTTPREDYKRWADKKLAGFTNKIDDLIVEIADPAKLKEVELGQMLEIMRMHNLVFFQINQQDDEKSLIKALASKMGMGNYEHDSRSDKDGLTEIRVHNEDHSSKEYIPYTCKNLKWHTDGYYNDSSNSILAWLLYCREQSKSGGINKFIDHEIVYILYNQMNKNILDLMCDDAYEIPKNNLNQRDKVKNSVFSFNDGILNMKYSMRERNIIWNKQSKSSSNLLKQIINQSERYHIVHKLKPGQGVVTNNVIHMRTSFTNSLNKNRILYRLRSKKRVGY